MIKTFPGGKKKCLTFSYDDAGVQDIQLIKLFDQYNIKGTFNINSGQTQKDGPYWRVDYNRLTSEVLTEVYKNHEIAGHTYSHPDLTVLDEEDIFKEIHNDRLELEKITGRDVRGFAYPFGTYKSEGC